MTTYVIDTNVLLRYLLRDDERQYQLAKPYFISKQHNLYLPIHVLCEAVWFIKHRLKVPRCAIAALLTDLVASDNVITEKNSFDQGIAFLQNGGDFADGVIADFVCHLEDAVLLTFDKNASKIADKFNITNELL
ncbi:hypothetical protein B0181_10875 [Moraxella caviae]|uniref:PIN domain n=1 Tax=Moraxella caviae TaxID=34060 RepID=A0A1S9ZUM9_9GAMM|nr:type II toxin-antitoxin system VapC family toxin [Moraxella caviae]OOR87215.1 hypothetical protein B0181_10875 [Moraxella caviae]STZ09922.1 PIN domain [Moraxella caviae]